MKTVFTNKLNSGNACHHSVQNIILSAVLYEFETLSVTLKNNIRLWMTENKVMRRILKTNK